MGEREAPVQVMPRAHPISRVLLQWPCPAPTPICLGEGGKKSWFFSSSLSKWPSAPVVKPLLPSSSRMAQVCWGQGARPDAKARRAHQPSTPGRSRAGRALGRGKAAPGRRAAPPPLYTLTAPCAAATRPDPARRSPRSTGTFRKARRTYIGRAVRRARAAPVRSAPLPAAAVLLGRRPSAAARRGRRPAPAGPLAAGLPPVVSLLGAQPGGREQGGSV